MAPEPASEQGTAEGGEGQPAESATAPLASLSWKAALLYGLFSLLHADLIRAGDAPFSWITAGILGCAAVVFLTLCLLAQRRKDTTTAARRLFLCGAAAMHAILAGWGVLIHWTTFAMYLASEAPMYIAFALLFRKVAPERGVRAAYTFLTAKAILVDLILFWYARPDRSGTIPLHSVGVLPPLAGWPLLCFQAVPFVVVGIYVYKLTSDPARWTRSMGL